ncbi:RecQ family ATP-dependent DNA helicase [Aquimarina rhabdastrellae]
MPTPVQILEQYWNYTSFKPLQEEIIQSVLDNNDTFALLPTGGGKSICFQVPAMALEGICIVISPLVSLMQDQVQNLKRKGIKAMALTSGLSYSELDTLLDNCIYGNYKFLYLSPERLQQDLVKERIKLMNVNLIAVDEAHCISQWGNDFRPSYKKIKVLRILKPTTPLIALTASATKIVIDDIVAQLDLFQPKIFQKSFMRENLGYMVYNTVDKFYKIRQILTKQTGSSIIYVRNRKAAIEISRTLSNYGISSTYYHGGISPEEKQSRFEQWFNDKVQVMVATNAFGMGIDKPDVRTVIHINLPESIESYFQEAGRAGRDGKRAYAILLKNDGDIVTVKNQFIKVLPQIDFIKTVYKKLCNYFQISYGEGDQTTHNFDYNHFCRTYNLNTIVTYNALKALDQNSVLIFTQRYIKRSTIHITANSNAIIIYLEQYPQYALVTKAILRTYTGIFDEETAIDLNYIAQKVGTTPQEAAKILKEVEKSGLLLFNHIQSDAEITFLVPREDDRTVNMIQEHIKKYNSTKIKQVEAMITFTQNDLMCKSRQLLSYFGEHDTKDCGICSVCYANKKEKTVNLSEIKQKIITLLTQQNLSSRQLIEELTYSKEIILDTLQLMLEQNIISVNMNNQYQLILNTNQ